MRASRRCFRAPYTGSPPRSPERGSLPRRRRRRKQISRVRIGAEHHMGRLKRCATLTTPFGGTARDSNHFMQVITGLENLKTILEKKKYGVTRSFISKDPTESVSQQAPDVTTPDCLQVPSVNMLPAWRRSCMDKGCVVVQRACHSRCGRIKRFLEKSSLGALNRT